MAPLLWFWHNVLFSNWAELVRKKDKNYLATIILRKPEKKFYFSFTKIIFPFSIFPSHHFSFSSFFLLFLFWTKISYSSVYKHSLGSYKELFHFTFQYLVFFPCVSQPGNSFLPLVIFRGPENTEEENEHFSLGEAFSSHSGLSPPCFWLRMPPDTCCQKPYIDQMQIFVWRRAFWVFLKGNGEITYCVSKKI